MVVYLQRNCPVLRYCRFDMEMQCAVYCNLPSMAQRVKCTSGLLEELSLDDETSQLINATLHC